MYFCIVGALLCLPPAQPGNAWLYASYYSPPIISATQLAIPAYANPAPFALASIDQPGNHFQPAVTRVIGRY